MGEGAELIECSEVLEPDVRSPAAKSVEDSLVSHMHVGSLQVVSHFLKMPAQICVPLSTSTESSPETSAVIQTD